MAKKKKRTGAKSHSHASHAHHAHKKKKPMGEYVFGIAVFVVLVAIVAGLIYLASKSGELRLTKQSAIAAKVNGEEISTAYIDEQYDRVPVEYRSVITKETLLNQTINEMILLQEAKERGIEVSEEDVSAEIEAAMVAAGVTEDQLDERLAEQNITREFLEDLYSKQLVINELLEEVVFTNIKVTQSEIEEFYDSRIRAMHVLVETEEDAEDIIERLKGYSLNRIEAGFRSIAEDESIDPSAAQNGGDLGEFSRGQMVPEFEKAAFALEEYAFTAEPVQTQFGYHVILKLPKEETIDDQYAAIQELLLTQKKAQAVPLYVEQLRSKADVEVLMGGEE